ncbi:hypothetical protein ACJ41O_006277 [Fusarium nematophilum]
MSSLPRYIYDPLDQEAKEIRLLTILPSHNPEDPIRCTLARMPLSTAQAYKALSYVWGDPSKTAFMVLQGAEVQITASLSTVLRYIRHPTNPQIFWIDGVCINQADTPERCEQVLLMAEIFQKADIVVAWLGEEQDNSAVALDMISRLSGVWAGYMDRGINPGEGLRGVPGAFEPTVWASIAELFKRAWWTRLWIYQEVILARNVIIRCGQSSVDWTELTSAYFLLRALLLPHNAQCLEVRYTGQVVMVMDISSWTSLVIDRWNRHTQAGLTMVQLLRNCLSRQSTDPRDRFYAVMGMAEDAGDFGKPTYDSSVESVYENFARTIISRDRSLALLCYARSAIITPEVGVRFPLESSILPSWAPHWVWGLQTSRIDPSAYSATPSSRPECRFTSGELCVRGAIIDAVADIAFQPFLGKEKRRWVELAIGPGLPVPYPTGIPRLQAFFRTLLADCFGPGMPRLDPGSEEFANFAAAFLFLLPAFIYNDGKVLFETVEAEGKPDYQLGFLKLVESEHTSSPTQQLLETYFGSIFPAVEADIHRGRHSTKTYSIAESRTTRGRCFFVTQNGYMGLASSTIQNGDGIWILPGCPLPLILRPCGDSFVLVGECFILGFMDGEALGMIGEDDGQNRLRELSLR